MTLPETPAPVLTLLSPMKRGAAGQCVCDEEAPPQSHRVQPVKKPSCTWLFALRRDLRMRETAVAWVARSF